MLASVHMVAGSFLAQNLKEPWLVAPLAFSSHFLLDMIPHQEFNLPAHFSFKKIKPVIVVFLDLLAGLFLSLALLKNLDFSTIKLIGLGLFFALLPDILENLTFLNLRTKFLDGFRAFHHKIQNEEIGRGAAFLIQIALIVSFFLLNQILS